MGFELMRFRRQCELVRNAIKTNPGFEEARIILQRFEHSEPAGAATQNNEALFIDLSAIHQVLRARDSITHIMYAPVAAQFVPEIPDPNPFHQGLGPRRKEARLRYLRDYWAKRLLQNNRVRMHTSLKPNFSCGLANVEIKGVDPGELTEYLWEMHHIIVTPIKHPEFEGIRVTPNVYTLPEELDRFCDAMEAVIKKGLPAS